MLGTMEQRTEGMKRQANELIEQAYNRGYKAGQESDKDIFISGILEQGRNEAWEAAKKVFNDEVTLSIFGLFDIHECIVYSPLNSIQTMTASEAIQKIREYEEKKKQEEDSEIRVGDEVIYRHGELTGIVTSIYKTKKFDILWNDGSVGQEKNISDFKKTGRTFPQIVEVLKKMQEE